MAQALSNVTSGSAIGVFASDEVGSDGAGTLQASPAPGAAPDAALTGAATGPAPGVPEPAETAAAAQPAMYKASNGTNAGREIARAVECTPDRTNDR